MRAAAAYIQHLEEARRRSLLIWNAIPQEYIHWKLDEKSMSLIETVRHVLDCDEWYRLTIVQGSSKELNYDLIYGDRPYTSIQNEIEFNRSHRSAFLESVRSLSEEDLENKTVGRARASKKLFAFLSGISYHEAFHAGQIAQCLRILKVPRPDIRD
jgi:uncharacterized damage-inducible protein DinB